MSQNKRGTDTREKVLAEAAKQFYLQGYKKTTMRSLANAVGIKHPSLFSIFENKSDIAATILSKYYFGMQRYATENVLGNTNINDSDLQSLLLFYAMNYVQVYTDHHFAQFYSEFYEEDRLKVDEVILQLGHLNDEVLSRDDNVTLRLEFESLGVISMMLIKHLSENTLDAKEATLYFVSKIYNIQKTYWNLSFSDIEKYYNDNWETIENKSKEIDFYQLVTE